jgi:hypothetical protein
MNWLHFLLWVAGIYVLYYLAVILLDVAGARRAPAANSLSNELRFSETHTPVQLAGSPVAETENSNKSRFDEPVKRNYEPEVIGSGGVVIDNLFRLAKQEAIIYTRSVSF